MCNGMNMHLPSRSHYTKEDRSHYYSRFLLSMASFRYKSILVQRSGSVLWIRRDKWDSVWLLGQQKWIKLRWLKVWLVHLWAESKGELETRVTKEHPHGPQDTHNWCRICPHCLLNNCVAVWWDGPAWSEPINTAITCMIGRLDRSVLKVAWIAQIAFDLLFFQLT